MARTPLASRLQDALSEAADQGWTRGTLLRRAGIAGAAVAGLGRLVPAAEGATAPSVAVVGAGLAGLIGRIPAEAGRATARHLRGLRPRSAAAAGRSAGAFADGQIAEHGGELIDQGHTADAAARAGARARPRQPAPAEAERDRAARLLRRRALLVRGGDERPEGDLAAAALRPLGGQLSDALQPRHRPRARARRDVDRRLDPGRTFRAGSSSKLGQLLDVAYNIEYGAETNVQSSLNLLYLLGYSGPGQLRIFGKSNEKYHVRGGNDQIAERLADALAGSDHARHRAGRDRSERATAATGSASSAGTGTTARRPPTASCSRCRSRSCASVDYSKAGFAPRKQTAIQQLGMGTNSKLHVQFNERCWNRLGSNGETYADTGYQNTWEVTRAQAGAVGDPRRLHGRQDRRELRQRHARRSAHSSSSARSSRCCRAARRTGTARPRSTTGPATAGRRAPTPTGRSASTRRSPASSASAPGQLPLRRRAHLDRLPGLPQRRRRIAASAPPARSSPI